jgi:hypothetical protein
MSMLSFLVAAVAVSAVGGQDKKWEPPAAPDGFKAIASSDGIYRFAIPTDAKVGRRSERTVTANRIKSQVVTNNYTAKGGTALKVEMVALSGTGTKGLKVEDVVAQLLDDEKTEGFTPGEPKEVKVGELKGQDYLETKDGSFRRLVVVPAKPRIFLFSATAPTKDAVGTKEVDSFVTSLVMVPPEVVKAAAKEKAEKDAKAGEDNLEKYGTKWTLDPKVLQIPDADAIGMVRGREIKPDAVTYRKGGTLEFRQGKGTFAEAQISIWLVLDANDSVAGKAFEMSPGGKAPEKLPHISISTLPPKARVPTTESFVASKDYCLKLTFGDKDKDGSIPGTIFLATNDKAKSFFAGKFKISEK